ncbi:MAG: HAMP domain-containing protein [Desulfobacteraceae bacterium]|nr:HAMP domain-containing protein [Desulfobacteraceae bacterium]
MDQPRFNSSKSLSVEEQRRRRRERILIIVLIAVVTLFAVILNNSMQFGAKFSISSQVLIFILVNINLLLLLLLIFLVVRNLVKLIYDRKRKVMGTKLRMRLVIAFVSLTLMPSTVLFVFAINFITSSIEFWFNVPVEQALENSLDVGHSIYKQAEKNSSFFLKRVAYQIKRKNLLEPGKNNALSNYIQVVQREFNMHGLEVYGANAKRLFYSLSPVLEDKPFAMLRSRDLRKKFNSRGVHTVTTTLGFGEILRTVCTVPFKVSAKEAQGYLSISLYLPPELTSDMASIAQGFEEYQQIKLLKRPIQSFYYITLSVVALLVVFCAVWFGFYLAKTITIPIKDLADGTRRVAEGDLNFELPLQADDEIGSLVSAFNKMTRDLRTGREQLELSAQMLRDQNLVIEERRRYIEIVLKNVSAGVITLDAKGIITSFNTAAENMLGVRVDEIMNHSYRKLLSGPQSNLVEEIRQTLDESRNESVEMPLRLSINDKPRSFLAYINKLKDEAGRDMGMVMVLDDLTELEKAQRMAAWREVARRIAHEVKNPLTPIKLSAQRLKRKYSGVVRESVFDECIQMIINHVELIRNLVNEFSAYARFPTADPKPCYLKPIVEEIVALYKEGRPLVILTSSIQDDLPLMNLDRQQIKQALINLVDNAIVAIRSEGHIRIDVTYDSILKLVRLEVADDGIGIANEDKIRLFEPNFSTKKSGMGLGLTIVNSIITDHNGRISVQDNHPKGAKFVIELPAPGEGTKFASIVA